MSETIITESKEEVKSFRKTLEAFCEDISKTVSSNTSDEFTYQSIKSLFRDLKVSKKEFDKKESTKKTKKVRIKIENKKLNKIKNSKKSKK